MELYNCFLEGLILMSSHGNPHFSWDKDIKPFFFFLPPLLFLRSTYTKYNFGLFFIIVLPSTCLQPSKPLPCFIYFASHEQTVEKTTQSHCTPCPTLDKQALCLNANWYLKDFLLCIVHCSLEDFTGDGMRLPVILQGTVHMIQSWHAFACYSYMLRCLCSFLQCFILIWERLFDFWDCNGKCSIF